MKTQEVSSFMNNDTARCPGMNIMKSGISYCVGNFSTAARGGRYSFCLM
jgi:hypothetical protein